MKLCNYCGLTKLKIGLSLLSEAVDSGAVATGAATVSLCANAIFVCQCSIDLTGFN
jgi:hypothetical protein